MEIHLNGETREIVAGSTLESLLGELKLSGKQVAVEVNENIIQRARWGKTHLEPGDRVEIVHFVGGG